MQTLHRSGWDWGANPQPSCCEETAPTTVLACGSLCTFVIKSSGQICTIYSVPLPCVDWDGLQQSYKAQLRLKPVVKVMESWMDSSTEHHTVDTK